MKKNRLLISLLTVQLFYSCVDSNYRNPLIGKWQIKTVYDYKTNKSDTLDSDSFFEIRKDSVIINLKSGKRHIYKKSEVIKLTSNKIFLNKASLGVLTVSKSKLLLKTEPDETSKEEIVFECIK